MIHDFRPCHSRGDGDGPHGRRRRANRRRGSPVPSSWYGRTGPCRNSGGGRSTRRQSRGPSPTPSRGWRSSPHPAGFFFHGRQRKFPFATLTTADEYERFSDLKRPGVFRLNVGVSKQSFQSLFGGTGGHDFTALDQLMPHPVYGKMYWVCVLNPSPATFEAVKPLLAEAYEMAVRKQASPPGGGSG
ncbi:MAG TPA: DUF6194 family protein [Gemmataceae bacterium]|nr:DUF6194 family protein [Gemmataceae bacterium]